ncbi:MAG: MBL fold metallo-hydrolase, partial [Rikenellaceae bacterium]|nr:MBL fold metallo-hydrolase [Rikenellaceae bacterium]
GGLACGFVIRCGAEAVYYAGDTCLFGDMRLVDELYKPTVGLLPIGGKYTMDAEAAAYACNNFFNFRTVIPMHYDTFPPISADPARFSALVKKGAVRMLALGEALEI